MVAYIEDDIVIAGIITRSASIFVHIALAAFIYFFNDLCCLLRTDASLLHQSVDALIQASLDENTQMVGMIAEHIETATASYHT